MQNFPSFHLATDSEKFSSPTVDRPYNWQAQCAEVAHDGTTPFHAATSQSSVDVMHKLHELGVDVNARATDDLHALHIADKHGNKKAKRKLEELGAALDDNNEPATDL